MIEEFNKKGFIVINIEEYNLLQEFNKGLESLIKLYCEQENIITDDYVHKGFIHLDKINHNYIHIIYNTIRNSNVLNQIINSKKLSSSIKILLNLKDSDLFYTMYQVCRMDPPSDKKFILNWHQETFSTIPYTQSLQIWAPLIDRNSKENGSIDVLVGSHKEGIIPHYIEETTDGYKSFHLKEDQISKIKNYERITVDLKPGEFLIFHPNLIHKSNYNKSDKVRYSFVSHVINPFDKNFQIMDYNEIIRLNRKRCINANDFKDLIEQEKQTYY